tara:strand:+ start:119 stop:625 length:507 start_codon:yes stop_codon:yes gene_type:complete
VWKLNRTYAGLAHLVEQLICNQQVVSSNPTSSTRLEEEEKGNTMREWVYDCWNSVMDYEKNPLSAIPDFSTRHMIMQVLAWMWCIVFGIIVGSMYAGVFSMVLHTLLLGAIAVTVATFETAQRKPTAFNFISGYNSFGRSRTYTIWRDEKGNAHKVPLDKNDPGGEHE